MNQAFPSEYEDIQAQTPSLVGRIFQGLVLAIFLINTAYPMPALAYVNVIEGPDWSFGLLDDVPIAQDGIKAFPKSWTATDVLHSPYSHTPNYSPIYAPGTNLRVLATAYSSSPEQTDGDPFTTASGTKVHIGTLAANFLPLGTVVEIKGKKYTVEDRLNNRYNGRFVVDLWFPSQEQALNFGIRLIQLQIVSLP